MAEVLGGQPAPASTLTNDVDRLSTGEFVHNVGNCCQGHESSTRHVTLHILMRLAHVEDKRSIGVSGTETVDIYFRNHE